MILSMLVLAAAFARFVMVSHPMALFFISLVKGLAGAFYNTIAKAMMGDLTPEDKRFRVFSPRCRLAFFRDRRHPAGHGARSDVGHALPVSPGKYRRGHRLVWRHDERKWVYGALSANSFDAFCGTVLAFSRIAVGAVLMAVGEVGFVLSGNWSWFVVAMICLH
jgi:hypothetical protein